MGLRCCSLASTIRGSSSSRRDYKSQQPDTQSHLRCMYLPALDKESNGKERPGQRGGRDADDFTSCTSAAMLPLYTYQREQRRTGQAAEPGMPGRKSQVAAKNRGPDERRGQAKQDLARERDLAAGRHPGSSQVPDMQVPAVPGSGQDDAYRDSDAEDLERSGVNQPRHSSRWSTTFPLGT